MQSIDRTFDHIGGEMAALREEMRALREGLTGEIRQMRGDINGLRADFATSQRQLIQIGFGLVGTMLAVLCAVILATV